MNVMKAALTAVLADAAGVAVGAVTLGLAAGSVRVTAASVLIEATIGQLSSIDEASMASEERGQSRGTGQAVGA